MLTNTVVVIGWYEKLHNCGEKCQLRRNTFLGMVKTVAVSTQKPDKFKPIIKEWFSVE